MPGKTGPTTTTAEAILVFWQFVERALGPSGCGANVESRIRLATAKEFPRDSEPPKAKRFRSRANAAAVPCSLRLSVRPPFPLRVCADAGPRTLAAAPEESPPTPEPPDPTICGS